MYRSWCSIPSNKEVHIHVRLKDFFIKEKETPVGVQVVVILAIQKEEVHVHARVVLLLDVQIE